MSARQPWAAASALQVRAAGPSDRDRVARFLAAMDREGLYRRHFGHGEAPNLALLTRLAAIDGGDRVALLALGGDGEVLAHAEYVASDGAAEFALMVLPAVRTIGLGRRLLGALLEAAAAAGLRELNGIVQASNTAALQLVLGQGFRVRPGDDRTTVIVWRALMPTGAQCASQTGIGAASDSLPTTRHDPDRTPLHRRPGPRAPLWPRGGQMQCLATDLVHRREEAGR